MRQGGSRARLGRLLRWLVASALVLAVGVALALWVFNPRLTAYLEGPSFRTELDKETSKGLHFSGSFSAIQRVGFAMGYSPHFEARDGVKAFKSLSAERITGEFNPLGVFLRRWQLEYIHIAKAKAEIQIYTPKPDHKPPKPWYARLMPDRVYLKQVTCDDTDILWHMNKREAGFYGVRMLITPYGRDFEYHGTGGVLKMPQIPDLTLNQIHLVITREWITLHEIQLAEGKEGTLTAKGVAGLKEDKSLRAQATFEDLPLEPWLPKIGAGEMAGTASGRIEVESKDETMEQSSGKGTVRVRNAKVAGMPFLDYLATAMKNKDIAQLKLSECAFDFAWDYPRLALSDLRVEAPENFRIEGSVAVTVEGRVEGTLELGLTDKNLAWLPKAKERVFTREKDGYHWTTVRLGGTLKEPENDLLPRIADTLKASPDVSAGLLLREFGEWIEQKFKKGPKP